MSQFRTTADYVTAVLRRAGEPTNGNSSFTDDALTYLNKLHHIVLAGGSVFNTDVDDTWTWARARFPLILELLPAVTDGSVSLTQGSQSGTFSVAPTQSVQGWHIQAKSNPNTLSGDREYYKIIQHTANSTAFQIDSQYVGGTGSGIIYNCFKLDYELVPSYLYVDSTNDKINFFDLAVQTQLTATLTHGSYTPAELATHAAARITIPSAATWTGSYDDTTRKFTLTSDLSGGATRQGFLGASGTDQGRSALALLGFDDLDTAASNTAALTSAYILGGISRLIEPVRVFRTWDSTVDCVDNIKMAEEYPLTDTRMGLPTKFARMWEDGAGRIVVRFNKYPQYLTKLEFEYVGIPRDLQNNAASLPLIPRKYSDLLEYGAASFISMDKEDDKAVAFAQLAGKQLEAMQRNNRAELYKAGKNFGEMVPRLDMTYNRRQRLRYGYTADTD